MKNYKITLQVDQDQLHALTRAFGDMVGIKNFLLSEATAILSEVAGDTEVIQIEENTGNVTEIM